MTDDGYRTNTSQPGHCTRSSQVNSGLATHSRMVSRLVVYTSNPGSRVLCVFFWGHEVCTRARTGRVSCLLCCLNEKNTDFPVYTAEKSSRGAPRAREYMQADLIMAPVGTRPTAISIGSRILLAVSHSAIVLLHRVSN
eukprot:COSAG02_NODE_398_length_23118_cov_49.968939_5_plen_139_part_00